MPTRSESKGGGSDDDELGSEAEAVDDEADDGDQEPSARTAKQHAVSDAKLGMHLPGTALDTTMAEAAVERSGYRQVRAAHRQRSVRKHTATRGGCGSPAGRVSPCSCALPPVSVHAHCCRSRHSPPS